MYNPEAKITFLMYTRTDEQWDPPAQLKRKDPVHFSPLVCECPPRAH